MAKKKDKPDWLDDDDFLDQGGQDDVLDAEDVLEADGVLDADDVVDKAPLLRRSGSRQEDVPKTAEKRSRESTEPESKRDSAKAARLTLHTRAVRPGEQEVLKSPFVLTLGGITVVLAVLAGGYWFMIGRDTLTRELMAIEQQVSENQYAAAIQSLETFLARHPSGELSNQARIRLGKVRIDKEINGAVPDWRAGLDAFNQMLKECRDLDEFGEEKTNLEDYAKRIALGSLDTAAKTRNKELLSVSDEAAQLLERFSDPEQPPTEARKQIQLAKDVAVAAILKSETVTNAFKEIEQSLQDSKPIVALESRRRLLDRYPDLEKDRKLAQYLEQTLETERKLVKIESLKQPAQKEERPLPVPAPLVLTLHTRVRTDESSEGRTVWAVSQGCLYGVDTITGDTVWRRPIGQDTPFFPITVETAIPGLVCFDTRHGELIHLNRQTGELAWRLPLDEPVSGQPLIHQNQIYLPTQGVHLYRIDLQSGEITSKLTFSQPVSSPPALMRDEAHLVVAGNEAVSYTLTLKPLECVRVSFTAQKPGSLQIPAVPMGSLLLVAQNDQVNGSILRVLDASKPQQGLPEVGATRISALIKDQVELFGNRLFVVGEKELLSVYSVSDEPDQPKLTAVAQPPTQTDYTGPIYLRPGPDGRLWLASDNVKQFQLTTESLSEETKKRIYIGAAGQPLQAIGRTLFVGRQQLESNALALIQVDGEDMVSSWRTVLGCGLLAVVPTGSENVLCLTKSGDAFQVSAQEVQTGGFRFRADGSVKIPEGLAEPLKACALPGGKIAVACAVDPKLWIINQIGKVEQELALDGAAVAPPVPLAGGVVVPLATKLKVLAVPGIPRVEDFLAAVGPNEQKTLWTHVFAIDQTHLGVIDSDGKLSRLEFRTAPQPHLQPLDSVSLGQPVDINPILDQGKLIVTDASGKLQVLNAIGFERMAEAQLDRPAVGKMALVSGRLLVTTAAGQLECFDANQSLKKLWSQPIGTDLLADTAVLEKGALIVPTMSGVVKKLNPDTGEELKSLTLGQALEFGPVRLGQLLAVVSVDGAIYRIDSVMGDEG